MAGAGVGSLRVGAGLGAVVAGFTLVDVSTDGAVNQLIPLHTRTVGRSWTYRYKTRTDPGQRMYTC